MRKLSRDVSTNGLSSASDGANAAPTPPGPGVAPADRDRVFQPFQRLGDHSTLAGVGLGLAVARGFTRAIGGELALEDTPGGGATFVFSLRRAQP